MTAACSSVFNFAPSFAYFTTNVIGNLLTRDYYKDTINLSDVSVHNGIEHDASLTHSYVYLRFSNADSCRGCVCAWRCLYLYEWSK